MKPSKVALALEHLIKINRVGNIIGSPGGGKSAVVKQVGAKLGLQVLDIRTVLYESVDFRGLPYNDDNKIMQWSTPGILPQDGAGILFLDELTSASLPVQSALYRLIQDGELDGYKLPTEWRIVAAGNKATDGAVVNRTSTALASRMIQLPYEADLDDWRRNFAVPAGLSPEVIGFLSFRPVLFDAFAEAAAGERPEERPVDPRKGGAYPVPRTWEFVSDIHQGNPDPTIELDLYAGAVGKAAAAEFTGFLRVFRKIPSIASILLTPESAIVPEDPATLFATATALAKVASDANFGAVTTYAARLRAEVSVALVKQAITRTPALKDTRAFIEWGSTHSDVLV